MTKAKISSLKTNSLSSDELCKIISACKEAGVYEFKLGDLQISLGEKPETPLETPLYTPHETPQNDDKAGSMMDLMLSDPAAYEDAIMKEMSQDG